MYNLGLIGNCQVSALIDTEGTLQWLCLPRPDSPPVFGSLLDPEGGSFRLGPVQETVKSQEYVKNSAILRTTFSLDGENEAELIDFCPRFEQYGRTFRPASVIRILRPSKGMLRIKVSCKPVNGWEKLPAQALRGNSHMRFSLPLGELRLVTNMPLTYLQEEKEFLLQEPLYFALMWDLPLEDDLSKVCLTFLEKTENYWRTWVKHCSIPVLHQAEAIRSAITLKLHCYEDTGAILAATTTSLPEIHGEERNWDYRFCWLRDSFFTLSALYHLSHFEEIEGFLRFLINIIDFNHELGPVYTIDQSLPLPEKTMTQWRGFEGAAPVRVNNAAATQVQNDVYGELILTLSPIYFDERFHFLRKSHLHRIMTWLTERCIESIGRPDAGLWELRGMQFEHSFTNLMCWAGLDRMIQILEKGSMGPMDKQTLTRYQEHRQRAADRIYAAVRDGVVCNSPEDNSLDASLLLLPVLRFPDAALNRSTTEGIALGLALDKNSTPGSNLLFRYRRFDDFGTPESGFLICSFWLSQAYAAIGEIDKGRELLASLDQYANHLGLYAEHVALTGNRVQLGNFPQSYSHVGLINAAFAVSPHWMQVL